MRARWRAATGAVLVALGICAIVLRPSAAPAIPVPGPLIKVHTESGGVVRDRVIPLGGVPVPMDVDDRSIAGVLTPDVDVSVAMIAVDELPGKPIVPTIEVRRDPLAIARRTAAPPLRIDLEMEILDAANGLRKMATITYGYATPDGGLTPSSFRTKLVGPITGGFIDPLEAIVETPGYSGPLTLNAKVLSSTVDADFAVGVDPLPERIHFVEDPRADGLDFSYDHQGPIPDVELDAVANLRDPSDGRVRHVDAHVQRLPQKIALHHTNTETRTLVEYEASSLVGKPDVEANYRDTKSDGTVVADANVKVAGLPLHMTGEVRYAPSANGGSDVDSADFEVLDGARIDALDFLARNYAGSSGPVPEPALGPGQMVAVATRQMTDGKQRFRAAGRLRDIRSVSFERTGATNEGIDLTTDIGDGVTPLRAVVDLDNRGPGGPGDPKDRRHLFVDTTISPLPRPLQVQYDLAKGTDPTQVVYDGGQSVDVDAEARIAEADTTDNCGEAEVTCLRASVDRLPPHLAVTLPGAGGSDFSLSHTGTVKPDVRAVIDRTPAAASQRTWADVALEGVPREVRGRLDSVKDVVRAAEFHGCAKITLDPCTDTPGAIDGVTFTVRDQPARTGLPPRADTGEQFVALAKRDSSFEVTGHVDDVRKVAFHQRDADGDGEPDGTLGALVAAGSGKRFDTVVDQLDTVVVHGPSGSHTGKASTRVDVTVPKLPSTFSACVRQPDAAAAPPDPSSLPSDALLADCDRTDVLRRGDGDTGNDPDGDDLAVTPLSAAYRATSDTKLTASVRLTGPDAGDRRNGVPIEHVTSIDTTLDAIPNGVTRTDAITPDKAAGRKLELAYAAPAAISTIDFDLQSRRATSACGDPRPDRLATCVSGTLENLPGKVSAMIDPDPAKGDIDIEAPAGGASPLSINPDPQGDPLRISMVAPDDPSTTGKDESSRLQLDAHIDEITDHLKGRIRQLDDPFDNVSDPVLAEVGFDACPDKGVACSGIGSIDFEASTAAAGDPFASFPIPTPPTGVTQSFHFLQRGTELRADGHIEDFRELSYTRVPEDATGVTRTTAMRAGLGAGKALHAYVDRDTGSETQVIDGVLRDAAKTVELCLRDKVAPSEVSTAPNGGFCRRADARSLAVQATLASAATGVKPDIELRKLQLGSGGGTQVLSGTANIEDLGERVDVLMGEAPAECEDGVDNDGDGAKDTADSDCASSTDDSENPSGTAVAEPPTVLVEGRKISGGALDAAAGRVTFDLTNAPGAAGPEFPYDALDAGTVEPENDQDDVDGGRNNYLKVISDKGSVRIAGNSVVRDGDILRFKGSIPEVKRVSLAPRPCVPSDPRFPDLRHFTDETKRPEYLCVNAVAAQGRPLGLAIRTRDRDGGIVSLDDGLVTQLPTGDGGLLATITKTPDTIKLSKVCETTADAAAPGFCRPPLLSIQAKKGSGQTSSGFSGRLALGPLDLVRTVREDVKPADALSGRLLYEERPRQYPQAGARVKLGKKGDRVAVRAGLNVALPNHLDLDPPTSYRCARLIGVPLQNPCAADDERPGEWGADYDKGLEAIDVFFKLVGAKSAPGGSDGDPLGRVAMIYQDLAPGGTQIVLTGARPADARDLSADPPVPAGGSKHTPENPPPAGDADLGALVPGHLDVQVFMRNDFDAPSPSSTQQRFVQVDGRVNKPLTMAVRLNQPRCSPEIKIPGFSFPKTCLPAGGVNRAGAATPGAQFAVRNAPGLGGGVNDYSLPTFRVRAEIRGHKVQPPAGQPSFAMCTVVTLIGCVYPPNSGDQSGLVNPPAQIAWLDVQLNLDPAGTGSEPARTVEAVFDPIQRTADADVRGFTAVYPNPTPLSARGRARFTPQVAMRLDPFNIYARLGIGENWLRLYGDVVAHVASDGGRRLRLSQNAGKAGLVPDQGQNLLNLNIREVLEDDPAIGSTLKRDLGRVGILLSQCGGSAVDLNGFAASSLEARGLTVSPTSIPPDFYKAQPLLGPTIGILPGLWCTGTVGPFAVGKFPLDDSELIGSNPAPRFAEPGRPVPGVPVVANTSTPPPASAPQPGPGPVTVSGTETFCGGLVASTLVVLNGGRLEVGRAGTTVTKMIGGDPVTVPCDGTLRIEADDVDVQPGGVVTASGTRDDGPGAPSSGVGGGAGHFTAGGASGRGDQGGPQYGPSGAIEFGDAGSQGGAASQGGDGGLGGGLLSIEARNSITVDGTIAASGGRGDDAPGAGCSESAAGGGSGGAIQLTAPRVAVGGRLEVTGGHGGDGAHGGGGGAGGKLAIDTTLRNTGTASFDTAGGGGGAPEPGCQPGKPGSAGTSGLGQTQTRSATVRRAGSSTSRLITTQTVNLEFTGLQAVGGDFQFVYCRRSVGAATPNPFETAALDPPANATVHDLLTDPQATCADAPGNPTHPGEYSATVADLVAADAYYGYYTFAAEPKTAGAHCSDPTNITLGVCAYASVLPTSAAVRVGVDTTGPRVLVSNPNGRTGCPGSSSSKPSLCLTSRTGAVNLLVQDDMSGPAGASCGINRQPGDPFPLTCGTGRSTISLGSNDGLKILDVRIRDAAGNSGDALDQVEWFVDTRPPKPPVLTLQQSGTATNGWHRSKPTLKIDVIDDNPSSGFETDPVTLIVDGAQHRCGGTQTLPQAGSAATATCSPTDVAAFVPSEGVHVFSARATDRLGNTSQDGQAVTMRVDSRPPTSRLFVAPGAPDGAGGFYRTAPQVAFGASDGAGESGVDLRNPPPTGATENLVRYQIDGGTFTAWDPTKDITMPEGKHEVCWYAVDRAGNKEADGDPKTKAPVTNCRTVKVDATAPTATVSLTHATPNGSAGFYTVKPTVDPKGSDPVPSGVPAGDISGLDRVEYQLDGGPWTAAASFQVGDGEHEVRVRAFDKAGNRAYAEQALKVDTVPPSAALIGFPPAPNAQGWFRRSVVDSIAAGDGRIGSGVASATYQIGAGGVASYTAPFALGHDGPPVTARSTDRAGLTSGSATQAPRIDLKAPVPKAVTPDPNSIGGLATTTTLRFDVDGTLTPRVKVIVQIFDATGRFVHRIEAPGSFAGGYRDAGPGQVTWDGRGSAGRLVLPGLYHYRVQAIDQAGNAALSTESRVFIVSAL